MESPSPLRRVTLIADIKPLRTAWKMTRGWLLLGACAACAAPGAPGVRPPAIPEAAIGEIRLKLRRVEATRLASVRLDAKGAQVGATRGSLEVRLELQLSSRYPATLATVCQGAMEVAPSFRATDNLGKMARAATAEVAEDESGPVLRLTIRDLSLRASRLRSLEGQIPLYPEAKLVRFNVPWLKDDLPLETESTGAVATLRRFQLVEEDSTLWISVRPPAGLQVAPFEQPGTVAARALDMYGNLVNNGGITEITRVSEGKEPEFRFSAPAMRRTPARLSLDVLCVKGSPIMRPFLLREVALPVARP